MEAEWVVTILAGENETTFEISVIVDDLAEADEMFELELTVLEEPYFAVPCATESTATVVIEDDGMCGCTICAYVWHSLYPIIMTKSAVMWEVGGQESS